MSRPYQPDIDGLRAVAVSAVLAYHAGLGSAGYAGVDVFFVVSGYLITRLLLEEHAGTGRIDAWDFYARRARRIVPAALVVVVATVLLGTALLPASRMVELLQSAAASAAFVGNLWFESATGGYFDGPGAEMPLLHLWSLAVEEQFYLAWPWLLALLLRRPRLLRPTLLVLVVASLAGAEWTLAGEPQAAFFQTPWRLWELGAGAWVATGRLPALPARTLEAGLVLVAIALLVPTERFPGLGAVPAVLGTAIAIAAIDGGRSSPLLSNPAMRWVGLRSYSLYLWHWPLLALHAATTVGAPGTGARLVLCALAVLLAALSFRYVETPLRRARGTSRNTVAAAGAAILAVAAGALGAALLLRAQPGTAAEIASRDQPTRRCHSMELQPAELRCRPAPATRVAIWGDSMAYAWTPLVAARDPDWVAFTRDACGPYLAWDSARPPRAAAACRAFNAEVAREVRGLDVLVLAALWEDDPSRFAALRRTLAVVAPHVGSVLIVGPTPRMADDVPKCLQAGAEAACAVSRTAFDAQAAPLLAGLRAAAAGHANVRVLDPTPWFCDGVACPATHDGEALYWDSHHVSATAVRRVAAGLGRDPP